MPRDPFRSPPPPRLDALTVWDDSALGHAIDVLIGGDSAMERHVGEILARQRRLQDLSTEESWSNYLDVEQVVNTRYNAALLFVARWGWTQGRAYERGRRR